LEQRLYRSPKAGATDLIRSHKSNIIYAALEYIANPDLEA
jgi:hypothetical protein